MEQAAIYAGAPDGKVRRFDVASGKVGRVWNATNTPDFPPGEVRSLRRPGPLPFRPEEILGAL